MGQIKDYYMDNNGKMPGQNGYQFCMSKAFASGAPWPKEVDETADAEIGAMRVESDLDFLMEFHPEICRDLMARIAGKLIERSL